MMHILFLFSNNNFTSLVTFTGFMLLSLSIAALPINESVIISSPNYPDNYPLSEEITWTFSTNRNLIFEITLVDISINYEDSQVTLFLTDYIPMRRSVAVEVGRDLPGKRYHSKGELTVRFVSAYRTGRGFLFNITVVAEIFGNISFFFQYQ